MSKKLTLSLDEQMIEAGKNYARRQGISLSKLVENYISRLTEDKEIIEISPFVDQLSRPGTELPVDYDYRRTYRDYLEKKYQ